MFTFKKKTYFGTPPARSETRFGILGEFRFKILLAFKMINFKTINFLKETIGVVEASGTAVHKLATSFLRTN